MAQFTETDINDWDYMQSDRAYRDEQEEARYRATEINCGADRGGRWIEDPREIPDDNNRLPAKPRCRCALCLDPRDAVAALPPARETRRAIAEVA